MQRQGMRVTGQVTPQETCDRPTYACIGRYGDSRHARCHPWILSTRCYDEDPMRYCKLIRGQPWHRFHTTTQESYLPAYVRQVPAYIRL